MGGRYGCEPRWYRLTYNLASLVMFVWVMAADRTSPVLYFAPGIWSLVMYLAQLVIVAILFACVRQTGAFDFLGIRQLRFSQPVSSRLVVDGWYAVVRHPLYLFSILFLALNPVMTVQWLMLTALATLYFIVGGMIEERRLVREFGDEYRRYQSRVPFIIPAGGLCAGWFRQRP